MSVRTFYETMISDLHHSFRLLFKKRGLTLVAILTLALGIGANTAIFSLVESVLLKPLPYPEPDSIVLFQRISSNRHGLAVSPLDFQDLTSQSGVFASTAAFTTETAVLTGKGEPERLTVSYATSRFFDVLKMRPLIGRFFTVQEAKTGAGQSAILGYDLWKRRFGSDPNVAGTSIVLNGRTTIVLGVAPRKFDFPEKTEIWQPLIFSSHELDPSQRGARWIAVIGRLKGNFSLQQAQTVFQTLSTQFQKLYPRTHEGLRFSLIPLHDHLVKDVRTALVVLLVAVVLVLLIACANVTNLLMAHASTREGEVAVRLSMGAGRARLVQQFLTESLLLSLLAGIAGLMFHVWISDLLWKLGPVDLSGFRLQPLHIKIFAFNFGVAFVIGALVGLLPALQASSLRIAPTLSTGGKGTVSGRRAWAKVLVSFEVGLTLVLLTSAGLLIRSFLLLYHVNPGFNPADVLTFEISLPDSKYAEAHRTTQFYQNLTEQLETQPGVQTAGAIFGLPLGDGPMAASSFEITNRPVTTDEPTAGLRVITPNYFRAMEIPLKQGRWFDARDNANSAPVVVISESAARRYWPDENPIGRTLRIHVSLVEDRQPRPRRTIVGVVGDVKYGGLENDSAPELYIPHAQHPTNWMMVAVRAKSNRHNLATVIKNQLHLLDPDLPLANLKSMEENVGSSIAQRRFLMFLVAAFSITALLLAALGLYGLLSHLVVQRTREIGVRMALGAFQKDVVRLVLGDGSALLLIGLGFGFAGHLVASRTLSNLLFSVKANDPWIFGGVSLILVVVSLLACYFPARRASHIDPIAALRME